LVQVEDLMMWTNQIFCGVICFAGVFVFRDPENENVKNKTQLHSTTKYV